MRPPTASSDDFDETFRALVPAVRRLTWRVLGDLDAADDATAEAFIRALVRWEEVRSLPHRDAWILRVATNVSLDVLRRRRRETRVIMTAPHLVDSSDPALRLDLAAALAALPRRQREVVVLRHLAGLSEAEVGSALGVSINTVKTHGTRGLDALRERLGRDVQEETSAV